MHKETDIRTMNERDIPAAMRLKTLAGWNQTESDWQRFLSLDPEGTFVACAKDYIVASASTIVYDGKVGWIGMILVDPEWRRRGLGTEMLHHCIRYLQENGVPSIKLDATPMGQPVYEKIGFEEEYGLARWDRPVDADYSLWKENGTSVETLTSENLDSIRALDLDAFGCDRLELLRLCREACPDHAGVSTDGRDVRGYVLARIGTDAHHIGPLVARDADTACALLDWALERAMRPRVFMDISLDHLELQEWLRQRGFAQQRPFLRMYLGSNDFAGRPGKVYAITGPELG